MKSKWLIYTRGEIPLHRADLFNFFKDYSKLFFKKDFTRGLYICINGKLWWAWDKAEFLNLSSKLAKLLSSKEKTKAHFKNYHDYLKQGIKFSDKLIEKSLSNLSNSEIIELYKELEKENGKALGLSNVDLDVFDFFFEDFYEKKIKELINKKTSKFPDIVKELSIPAFESFVSREEKEIIKASLKKNLKLSDVKKICHNLYWVSMGWENPNPRKVADYLEIIEKYRKEKNLKKKLKEIESFKDRVILKRKEIIKKYKIDKEINHWLEIIDKYTFFHDLRKECQVKWFYAAQRLMEETGKRLNIPSDDLIWFRHEEVNAFLRGKRFIKSEAKKRKTAICLILRNGKIKIWSGKEAILQKDKEIKEEKENTNLIKGKPVSAGIIKATARICSGAEEAIKKINKGDVLVTGMTLPEYLPAMKKAGAVVTNEGGITCHAAVVSRELKIPCIVGTKTATKVLKDGDLVEVDANKGVVRILKKK